MEKVDPIEDKINGIILESMKKYKEEDLLESYKILLKLFQNLSANTYVEKYKLFNKGNATIKSKCLKIPEVLDILSFLNYQIKEGEILIWMGSDVTIIDKTIKNLEMFINLIESKLNNRKFMEVAEKDPEKMAYLENLRKKEELKKEEEKIIRDKLESHKEEVKANWKKNQDSKGKQIEFGSTECKFTPQAPQRG
jgi:hypothetical protein